MRAMNGTCGSRDLNSCSLENHTLKAVCLFDFDLPLAKKKKIQVNVSMCLKKYTSLINPREHSLRPQTEVRKLNTTKKTLKDKLM